MHLLSHLTQQHDREIKTKHKALHEMAHGMLSGVKGPELPDDDKAGLKKQLQKVCCCNRKCCCSDPRDKGVAIGFASVALAQPSLWSGTQRAVRVGQHCSPLRSVVCLVVVEY